MMGIVQCWLKLNIGMPHPFNQVPGTGEESTTWCHGACASAQGSASEIPQFEGPCCH